MKKLLSIVLIFVLVLSTVGCSQTAKKTDIEKAEQLIRTEKYEDAIKALEKILDKDEFNIEAWDLIAEAYIKAEEFEKADEWLEQYLDMVDENLDSKEFDVAKAIDSIGDFARDIRREGESVSSWYEKLKPEAINVDDLEYEYELGSVIEFDVPSGTELYYNLEGNSPKSNGTLYKDGITLDEEGYIYLELVLTNKYKEYGVVSSTYFDVYDPSYTTDDGSIDNGIDSTGSIDLVLPELNMAEGTYNEALELTITNYNTDNENLTIMYTTDGSDPTAYSDAVRYYYGYLPLTAGAYNIAIVAYDYEGDAYSDIAYYDYYIDHPDMITVGLYMLPDATVQAYRSLFDEAGWNNIYVEPVVYQDLSELDFTNLPDALITYGTYAEDLAAYNIVSNVEDVFNLADYDYVGNAQDIGKFNGVNYMMPLTVRPEFMVYGDYSGASLINWDFLKGESDWAEHKFAFAADSPEFFLGIYYGLGGPILDTENNNLNLDRGKLIEALTMISSMPSQGIGSKLYTSEEVIGGLESYFADYFVMGDIIERNPDYYFSQVGQMPLSNGGTAKYYNVATGLFLSSLSMSMDPTLEAKLINLYDYLTTDSYYMSDIAYSEGALPANSSQAKDYEFYLDMNYDDYVAIIENGISSIRSYSLYTVYDAMSDPLIAFVNGASPEEVADSILTNLSNSGN